MRAAEAASGASEWELMQRAGAGAAEWVRRVAAGRAVTVLCGPGNNGGDGYVIAEGLRVAGLDVAVVAPLEPATESARKARSGYGGEVARLPGGRHAPILVDALFGFGLARPLAGELAKMLEEARTTHGYIIAIDVPSGIESDTAAWLGAPFACDLTLALGAWKRAHWLMPASAAMGAKRLVDIGLGPVARSERLSPRPRLNAPAADSHKYRRGLLAVVAGEMPGAALLSAEAALRAGAGYVKLLSARDDCNAPPELVVERDLAALADDRLAAVLLGPGLGRGDIGRERLWAVLDAARPAVLDADALNLLDWDALEGVAAHRLLLTPHEGELARLCDAFGVTADSKFARAAGLRDATGANVLAKGPDNCLAPAQGGLVFFPAASSWLSVAGTGDVLAGIAASRLAHHGDAAPAGEEAVWIHREAARIAGPAFTAGDLARAVRPALVALL